MTPLKESVIKREILDLDSRGFPLRLRDVEDTANQLRTECGTDSTGLPTSSNDNQGFVYV